MTKKEILVRNVTSAAEVSYGGLSVAFYDNPRTYVVKENGKDKEITEDRLYISIDLIGKKDHVKRKALPAEVQKYARAYELYLAAKKAGGKLDETSKLIDSIAEKNKAIEAKEKEAASKDKEIEELHRKIADFEAKKKEAK
jgi:polyhydroxyalkanoate synthesis regulator phasin